MRMDRTRGRTAAELLNTLPAEELAAAFRELGDEPEADSDRRRDRRSSGRRSRSNGRSELMELVEAAAPVRVEPHPTGRADASGQQMLGPATRVFQALRILVNRELANLQQLLRVLPCVPEARRAGGGHQLPQRRGPAGEGGVQRRAAGGRLRADQRGAASARRSASGRTTRGRGRPSCGGPAARTQDG